MQSIKNSKQKSKSVLLGFLPNGALKQIEFFLGIYDKWKYICDV